MTLVPSTLRRVGALSVAILTATLLTPPAAHATTTTNTTTSTNWSGYAVHPTDARFRAATASWRQPTASCLSATDTYSSFWVGIGGYLKSSTALEQIGTELDCRADGGQTSSAWYELVPADSHAIRMTISSGDRLTASVTVLGSRVTVALADTTRDERFTRTIVDRSLDLTSADWIAEAPSDCDGPDCTILPLADFGSARFLAAAATTTAGVADSLTRAPWTRTRITLGSHSFTAADSGAGDTQTSVTATPSALTSGGGAFNVAYGSTVAAAVE